MNTSRIWLWAITVALGGFLFGFDTAVISGAEGAIQAEWGLSDLAIGQAVAMALYGTIIGALFGGIPADAFGRRTTLYGIGVLYLISAAGSAVATDVVMLDIFRFIGGLGVGASSVVAPMYITEVAPASHRGRLVAAFQFNLVLGILVAYFSNYLISLFSEGINWRLMLGMEVLPALAFLALLFKVPRSPRWLVTKANNSTEALAVLEMVDPTTARAELAAIQASNDTAETVAFGSFLTKKYRKPIIYAFLFALFNQISGINAVIYYAPRIFESAGLGQESALLSTAGIGVINVLFTVLGMILIDRSGRKNLMYIGSIGYIISLGAVAWAFFSGNLSGVIVPIWLFVFIASHAIGQGAVIWVFLSEIFGNEVRSLGASLGSTTHWIFAALIGGNFPVLASTFGTGPIFAFFAVCMVGQLLFVHFVMPETKGVDLEALQKQLEG
ncbi:sugar porter family MFS transporter [Lewinella sp. W8]|uniref:sugar porter family MFS transporter n=1 Tax=Lewinella sp. W8 TaxID=2528208 RepID=UPI001068AA85|nr:sugar porter family MFS transporter [Lewinella sp. W8]MTB50166.1 sugar porter family MFS transporter [Lewinella sp. W8]